MQNTRRSWTVSALVATAFLLFPANVSATLIVGLSYSGDLYSIDPVNGSTTFIRPSGIPDFMFQQWGYNIMSPSPQPGTFLMNLRDPHSMNVFGADKPILDVCISCSSGLWDTAYDWQSGRTYALQVVSAYWPRTWIGGFTLLGNISGEDPPSWRNRQSAAWAADHELRTTPDGPWPFIISVDYIPDRGLYGRDGGGAYYRIDTNTGQTTAVTSVIGFGLAYASATGTFLDASAANIYSIDATSGNRTLLNANAPNLVGLVSVIEPAPEPGSASFVVIAVALSAVGSRWRAAKRL